MKKVLLALVFLAALSSGAALEVSVVDRSGTAQDLFFDREEQVSDYYDGFPAEFEEPKRVGSFSFTDDSIVSEDVLLNISGKNSTLYNRKIQLFYGSNSGNLTEPILTHAARIEGFSGDYTLVDVEISSYRALYPGKIYVGLVNRTQESYDPKNLTEIKDNLMAGGFDVDPAIFRLDDRTRLYFQSAEDTAGQILHSDRNISRKILVTVKDNGEIARESREEIGGNLTLEFPFDGDEKVFINSILTLESEAIEPCEKVYGDNKYFILNSSRFNVNPDMPRGGRNSCVTIQDSEDSYIDFSNNTLDAFLNHSGSEREDDCGLTVNDSVNIHVDDSRVTQFNRGICIMDSSRTSISGTHTTGNDIGAYMKNSSSEVRNIKMRNNLSEVRSLNGSQLEFERMDLKTSKLNGSGSDLEIDDVQNPPSAPEGLKALSEWAKITATDNMSSMSRIGFRYYPEDSEPGIGSVQFYKIDREGGSLEYQNISDLKIDADKNLIYTDGNFNNFSTFGLFTEEDEEPDQGEGGGGGGSGGGGGGGGGGGLPGLPGTSPEPGEVKLNLSLKPSSVTLQQGETGEVNFSLDNYGEVAAEDIYVTGLVRDGWSSGRQDFGNISPGSTVSDSILFEVYQSEIPGNYSVPVEVRDGNGTIYDRESINVVVEPRKRIRDLRVVEGPTFLTVTSGSTQEIAFLLRNTGDYDLEGVSPEARNLEGCVESIEGEHPLEEGEISSLDFEMEINDSTGRCVGIIAFNSEKGDKLAIKPVRINVVKPTILEQVRGYILPLLVLIWTLFTIYWLWRVRNER